MNTKELREGLGLQIARTISESNDPERAMEEIAAEAERRGLIDSAANLRRESALAFVTDLWLENPLIDDLLNLNRATLRDSNSLEDLADVLDALP